MGPGPTETQRGRSAPETPSTPSQQPGGAEGSAFSYQHSEADSTSLSRAKILSCKQQEHLRTQGSIFTAGCLQESVLESRHASSLSQQQPPHPSPGPREAEGMKELDPGTKPPHQADKETQAWSLDEGSEPADSHSELERIVQGLMLLVAGSRRCFANDKGQGHSHPSGLPWPSACSLGRVKQLPSESTCSLGDLAALHGSPALRGHLAVPAWTKPSKAPRASPQQVLVLLLCPQTRP